MSKASDQLPNHPFWCFSLQVYQRRPVKQALLKLQNHYQLHVNFLLFCCWYGKMGYGRLQKKQIRELLTHITPWHRDVVEALRSVRDELPKEMPKFNAIRQAILDEELRAEKIEQLLLADYLAHYEARERSVECCLADSYVSLTHYCQVHTAPIEPELLKRLHRVLAATFPSLTLSQIETMCRIEERRSTGLATRWQPGLL